jgi:hypothetical protein
MIRSRPAFSFATTICIFMLSCASIPSLNEAPPYSSYVETRKNASGTYSVEVFVLHRAQGLANDDLHELFIERWVDDQGAPLYALVLRYRGFGAEDITSMSMNVDGRGVELGAFSFEKRYSGRYIVERVSAMLTSSLLSTMCEGKTVVVKYNCKYHSAPIEITREGCEKLSSFIQSPMNTNKKLAQ